MIPKLAINADNVIAAESIKQIHDSYIRVGFTETQAFELVKIILHGTAIGCAIAGKLK